MRTQGTGTVVALLLLLCVGIGGMLILFGGSAPAPDIVPQADEAQAPPPKPVTEPDLPDDLPAPPPKVNPPKEMPAGWIRGRVADRIGTPVGGARIAVLHPRMDWRLPVKISAVTDENGFFVVNIGKYLPGEETRIVVDAVDQGFVLEERLLVPEYFGGKVEVMFRLERGRSIAGIVTGPEGEPLEEVEVHLQEIYTGEQGVRLPVEGRVRTGADGRFADDAFRPGIYRVVAQGTYDGHRFAVVKEGVAAGEKKVRLHFKGFGGRHFTFEDAQTGKQLRVDLVSLEFIYGHTGTEEELATWAEFEGKEEVVLDHLPQGHYRLSLIHPGYEEILSDLFFVEAGKDPGEICYRLSSLSR